ncbi:MAG: hypothetical protein KGI04_04970 [Candidatus Micrarchaeota archaeon]|nr:hypothetical protein [Candidatus Micrarchaeota archaeon]
MAAKKQGAGGFSHYYRFLTKWASSQKLKAEKFTLILSPHVDDAFLSLYSTIVSGALGRNIVCVNVFSVSDSKVTTNTATDFSAIAGTSITRLKEELEFADHLQTKGVSYLPLFLGFNAEEIDLYYQFVASRGARLLPSKVMRASAERFLRSYAARRAFRIRLRATLDTLVENFGSGVGSVLVPIAAGGSLDHLMLRQAIGTFPNRFKVGLYADVPYTHEYGVDSIHALHEKATKEFTRVQQRKFDAGERIRLFRKLYPSQYSKDIDLALRSIGKSTGEVIFWNR